MYCHADYVIHGPTLAIQYVDYVMVSAAYTVNRKGILEGIASRVTFKISPSLTALFYVTEGILIDGTTASIHHQIDGQVAGPAGYRCVGSHGGQIRFSIPEPHRMLIFSVQVGRFDIATEVLILRKYNYRPGTVHFHA
jgi:hypothetical protein